MVQIILPVKEPISDNMRYFLISIFILITGLSFGQITVDYYNPASITSAWTVGIDIDRTNMGQCFHVSTPITITSASLKLRYAYGTNSDPIQYAIYATTGTYGANCTGTGSPLALSSTIPLTTLTSNYTFQIINLTFNGADQATLPVGNYLLSLVWNYNSNPSPSPGGTTDGTVHPGNIGFYQNNISTWEYMGSDLFFYVYGISPTTKTYLFFSSPF